MNGIKSKVALAAILAITLVVASIGVAGAYPVNYNRQAAVNFAEANYKNLLLPGSAYFYVRSGDCTNFASQCLQAGGWQSCTTWWYDTFLHHSASWTVVTDFRNFAIDSGRATEYVFSPGATTVPSPVLIQKGDIIQMSWNSNGKTWDHTAVVIGTTYNPNPPYGYTVYVTQHSDNLKDISLEYVKSHNSGVRFRLIHLKDTYNQ
jgi:hypothetical protein